MLNAPARAATEWTSWGRHVRVVVTDADRVDAAADMVRGALAAVDATANPDLPDAEVHTLRAGATTPVTPLLARLVSDAVQAAELTNGAVSPNGAHWDGIRVHDAGSNGPTVALPPGAEFTLDATALASAADHSARTTADMLGCGVLVSVGGDIATAGTEPEGGWQVRVQDLPGDPTCQIAIPPGSAVATTSTVRPLHPDNAAQWRTVSVAAQSCTRAHAVATAAIGRQGSAIDWLSSHGTPARLVDQEMRVITLGGWPV
ncbi:FAD:protein FMN transferase [Rhodococcus sp. HNM0569]|uniref:FAD:protein FMN transferase n=1 Tax=Rhodococcus sp. HNM0569 TaxID=2716340 RepID=UPI00146BCB18|nr:FAD:protein FMN transferase [Rhodococcus sp. HNM0569]NLU82773.1 hypothetical protein [Rhodococcus sp. HNM0569]